MFAELKDSFMEAYDDNRDGKYFKTTQSLQKFHFIILHCSLI